MINILKFSKCYCFSDSVSKFVNNLLEQHTFMCYLCHKQTYLKQNKTVIIINQKKETEQIRLEE